MKYVRYLWKLVVYAGLNKKEYDPLIPVIRNENQMLLTIFSAISAGAFFLLLMASCIAGGFTTANNTTYLLCGIAMLMILFCGRYIVPGHPALIMVLVYAFEIILYEFGIHISLLHADKAAVSAVAILLVSPLLFYDRPINSSILTIAAVVVFCLLASMFKDPYVVESDIWNMITFGLVGIFAATFTMRVKIRSLEQSKQIEHMSQTDLLTGVKNRNYYENQMRSYPRMCRNNLVCVYVDVNGLHELNNRMGHLAGDKMLCAVASAMQEFFGTEHSYRVGGDEFVAFKPDCQPEEVSAEMERISRELSSQKYYISYGSAVREKKDGNIDMDEMIKEAETKMFAEKRAFYRQPEHNRRNR